MIFAYRRLLLLHVHVCVLTVILMYECDLASLCCLYIAAAADVLYVSEERALELVAIMDQTKRGLVDLGDYDGHVRALNTSAVCMCTTA
jgi:hypothetical protein